MLLLNCKTVSTGKSMNTTFCAHTNVHELQITTVTITFLLLNTMIKICELICLDDMTNHGFFI